MGMEVKVWLLSAVMIVVFLFKRSPRNANVVCLSVIPHYAVKLLSQPRVSQESAKSQSAKSQSAKSQSAKSQSAKSQSAKSHSVKSQSAKSQPRVS